jgi:peroxiredoxin
MMRMVLLACLAAAPVWAAEPEPPVPPQAGARVADFTLKDTTGRSHSLAGYRNKKAIVVVFIGTECPIANLYLSTLAQMHKKYADKGVQFLAINANDQDTLEEVVEHAREHHVPFPVLKDGSQQAADALGARRTPEAFLLDSGSVIRYHGRVDDQYGFTYRRATPSKTELKDALEELLAGKPVTTPQSAAVQGCVIGRAKKGTESPSK